MIVEIIATSVEDALAAERGGMVLIAGSHYLVDAMGL